MFDWMRKLRRRQVRPSRITPVMQQKMARSLTTLITAGGMQELSKAKKMSQGFKLRRAHFDQLITPPEEDAARNNLLGQFR